MRKILFGITFIIVVLLIVAGLSTLRNAEEVVNWETYTNEEYGVSFEYPDTWVVFEALNDPIAPQINAYKPGSRETDLPLNHFANATHVSIYPEGIPTEGVSSLREDGVEAPVSFETDQVTRYVLEDGTPFALYINPTTAPKSWGPAGFLWGRAYMPDMQTECRRGGEVIAMEACDPLASDDTIVYSGTPREAEWETVERVLESVSLDTSDDAQSGGNEHPLISVDEPQPGAVIESPLVIRGEARGQWYFEATFPIVLTDWDGRIIAEGFATAEDDWMTTDFVPFEATLEFTSPATADDPDFMKNGSIILQRSNPSGLPENNDAYEFRILFAGRG